MKTQSTKSVVLALREIVSKSTLKVSRYAADFYADALRVAGTSNDLLSVVNRFSERLGSPILSSNAVSGLLEAAQSPEANEIVLWLRGQPKIAIALCYVKHEELSKAISDLVSAYEPLITIPANINPRTGFDIAINATLEQPLSHGSDQKAGNATLFRRAKVYGGAELPVYSANAWAGQMRDLFAAHYLNALGFDIKKRGYLKPWFYHLLYSGGTMGDGAIPKSFERALAGAASGTVRIDGIMQLRNMIPYFSLLGGVGKYPVVGRLHVNDLRPVCREWGTGELSITSIMDWRYYTRRDDLEGRTSRDQARDDELGVSAETANTSMIVNVEALVEGTVLEGGIDIDRHATKLELSALNRGLTMMADYGYLGGKVRRGFGRVRIEYNFKKTLPPADIYDNYLAEKKEDILGYLADIGGLA